VTALFADMAGFTARAERLDLRCGPGEGRRDRENRGGRAFAHDFALADRQRFQFCVERHTDTDGVLAPADLAELVPDLAERSTWACGPVGLLEALEQHWDGAGIADRLGC